MIRLCVPEFDREDRARVARVLDSGQLVQGEMVAAFEAALGSVLGTEAIACSSGTAALHLALMAIGAGTGDEVVVPAFTWPSAAHAVVRTGARPVFVDIDPETLNLDPRGLEAAVSPRTRALLPIHQFGIPAPMDAVMAAASANGARVVEDAACAIGTLCGDRLAGTIGDLGCFSFHPRKVVTTGEGGAVVGRDPELNARVRRLRNHGQDPEAGLGERFVDAGLNYRMPEVCAALGIGQLERLDAILAARRRLAALYVRLLDSVESVHVPAGARDPAGNHQSFVVDVGTSARRDLFVARCAEAGVQTTVGTYAVPVQPVFRALGYDADTAPHAVEAMGRLLTLPLHAAMTDADVEHVVSVIGEIARST